MIERKRVYIVERTVTERYLYDPVQLAREYGVTTADEVVELFELHEGSVYLERFFYNDANPDVYTEIAERWDDE